MANPAELSHQSHTGFDAIGYYLSLLRKRGLGELVSPVLEREIARVVFFACIAEVAQPELRVLYSRSRQYVETLPPDETINSWESLKVVARHSPAAAGLLAMLSEWCMERHVRVQWVLDIAVPTISIAWRRAGTGRLRWAYPARLEVSAAGVHSLKTNACEQPEVQVSPPILPPYNPLGQTSTEYREQVDALLTAYCAAVEGQYRAVGCTPTRRLRRRAADDPWIHYTWLVRNRICGWEIPKIAENRGNCTVDYSAVSRTLREISELLELPSMI